jgi:hypothetical protein
VPATAGCPSTNYSCYFRTELILLDFAGKIESITVDGALMIQLR